MAKKLKKIIDRASGCIITKVCPRFYINSFYKNNLGKNNFNLKKSCLSISFDCDHAADIASLPSLLDILSLYSFKASFACIGKFIEKYPVEHARIIWEGHEIINHTYTHPNNEEFNPNHKFNELTPEEKIMEIEKCHKACKDVLGYEPIGFRTPHFGNLHTKDVYTILEKLGYKYSSSTSAIETPNHGLPFTEKNILEFPLSNCPEHPFAVFDSWHSLQRGSGKHQKSGEFYGLFKELVDIGTNTNSYVNLYFDPQDIVDSKDFKLMMDYVEGNREDIWMATYNAIFEKIYEGKGN